MHAHSVFLYFLSNSITTRDAQMHAQTDAQTEHVAIPPIPANGSMRYNTHTDTQTHRRSMFIHLPTNGDMGVTI
jgi:hypothetical protein